MYDSLPIYIISFYIMYACVILYFAGDLSVLVRLLSTLLYSGQGIDRVDINSSIVVVNNNDTLQYHISYPIPTLPSGIN